MIRPASLLRHVQTAVATCSAVLVILAASPLRGQVPRSPVLRSAAAAGIDALDAWTSRVEAMLRGGTLDIAAIQTDTMLAGRVHERLNQRHEGLPVFGGQLIRQTDGRAVRSVFGQVFENVTVPTTAPSVSAIAAAAITERSSGEGAVALEPELGILPTRDRFLLAYRIQVRSPRDIRICFVDAGTGAIVEERTDIKREDLPTIGKGLGVLGDAKKVSGMLSGTTLRAIDVRRPANAFTLDFRGSLSRLGGFFQTGIVFLSDVATSSGPDWTDPAVVDAHVHGGWVYDYYFKRFGRRGIDDRDLPIFSIVHPLARADLSRYAPDDVGAFINNAAYIGDGFLVFGDGDGRIFDYLSGALDVVGHELTHGVVDFTSRLDYRDESGALNEAFADIMGTSIEFFFLGGREGPQKGPNFLIAEDVTRIAPGYVRSLQNPMSVGDPDHYSLRQFIGTAIDNGGVHVNSTIVSHAFYLAVAGGRNRVSRLSVAGVGVANIERMERIFYRAFAFMLGPRAQFRDARAATLQAAAELYGSGGHEQTQLRQAWTAVGVE
jgi:thermolysin